MKEVWTTKAREKEETKLKPKSEKEIELDAVDGAFRKNVLFVHTPRTLVPSLPLPLAWLAPIFPPPPFDALPLLLAHTNQSEHPTPRPPIESTGAARTGPDRAIARVGRRSSARAAVPPHTPRAVAVALAAWMIARGGGGRGAGGRD